MLVITWSLGRRVLAEWVAKDFKEMGKYEGEVEAFSLKEKRQLLHFQSMEEQNIILNRDWFIIRQLLAIEPLVLDLVLGMDVVWKIIVWLQLLGLLIEFWSNMIILGISEEARRLIAINNFMDQLQKLEYAWIRVEIDAMESLKPGVSI